MAGLVPAIHGSGALQWFRSRYRSRQSGFTARIKRTFHARGQPRQRVPLGESLAETFAMFIGAASDVSDDASIERAVRTVRRDVDPAAAHRGNRTSGGRCRKDGSSPAVTTAVLKRSPKIRPSAVGAVCAIGIYELSGLLLTKSEIALSSSAMMNSIENAAPRGLGRRRSETPSMVGRRGGAKPRCATQDRTRNFFYFLLVTH
jgi:hypothetical protein